MRRIPFQIIVMMVLLCGAAGVMAGFAGTAQSNRAGMVSQADARPEEATGILATPAVKNDLQLLVELGNEHISSETLLTVKIQGEQVEPLSRQQAETSARELAEAIGLPEITADLVQGNDVFQAKGMQSGVSVQLDWALTKHGNSHIRAMLTLADAKQTSQMMTIQQQIQDEMNKVGIANTWNAAIQGYASKTESAMATVKKVENKIAKTLPIRLVEDYDDITTVSRSYEAPSLTAHVMSGASPIHMQIAVHEDSMKKSSRITIGFPVITVEY